MNKKTKKIPLRKCVVTKEQYPKQELFRIVKNKEGEVFVDETGRQNGRGAYLKKSKAVVLKAQKTKQLNKHLESNIPDAIYEEMLSKFDEE